MSNKQTLKLMPDGGCYPIWNDEEFDNIDPNKLPISDGLKRDLKAWADRYDAIVNLKDPSSGGFKSPEQKQQFKEDGKELHKRLQEELGEGVNVTYYVP